MQKIYPKMKTKFEFYYVSQWNNSICVKIKQFEFNSKRANFEHVGYY